MKDLAVRLKENWKSGLTVSLVSLPLSISLGIAAGATPLMGVITAIWAGLVASLIGGSHYNVTGPTGALSGILAAFALSYGMQTLPLLSILAGILIIIAFAFKLERFIAFVPASVVHGFTLGVAFIIALNQFNFAFGLQGLPVHSDFIKNVLESFKALPQTNTAAFVIFAIGLTFLFFALKKIKYVPGPIILALAGIAVGYVANKGLIPLDIQTLATKFGDIPSALATFPILSFHIIDRGVIVADITVAIVAILETLISAKIADGMTHTKYDQRKEMLGLGLANIASGMTGGIPATAALARTALNVKSGATHRTSGILNAVAVAIIALILLPTFKYLPLAIVASILVYVAIRMVEAEHFKHLYSHDKTAFWLSIVVAIITVVEEPIMGILVGSVLALLMFVRKLSFARSEVSVNKDGQLIGRIHAERVRELDVQGDTVVYRFSGELTYVNGQGHLEALRSLPDITSNIVLGFRNLFYIDVDGLDIIEEVIETLESRGKTVSISSINQIAFPIIAKTKWYNKLQERDLVFESSQEAVKLLHERV